MNAVEHRSKASRRKEREHSSAEVARERDLLFDRAGAKDGSEYSKPLSHQHRHVQLGATSRSETDRDHPPLRREHVQVSREITRADKVEYCVNAGTVRLRKNFLRPVGGRLYPRAHAKLAGAAKFFRGARRADRMYSRDARELHGCGTDSASHCVDQQCFAWSNEKLAKQGVIRGEKYFRNGGGFLPRELQRNCNRFALV